jgi:hypothetical protein
MTEDKHSNKLYAWWAGVVVRRTRLVMGISVFLFIAAAAISVATIKTQVRISLSKMKHLNPHGLSG